jgi:hypothetical protein
MVLSQTIVTGGDAMFRTASEALTALTESNDPTLVAIMVPVRRGAQYTVCHTWELTGYTIYQRLV